MTDNRPTRSATPADFDSAIAALLATGMTDSAFQLALDSLRKCREAAEKKLSR